MNDIVYILKNDVEPNELRYSLRTVEKNFPHGRVFFFCGCPQGITPDRFVPFESGSGQPQRFGRLPRPKKSVRIFGFSTMTFLFCSE